MADNGKPADSVKERALTAIKKAKKPGTMLGLSVQSLEDLFKGYRSQIAQALPKHLTPERIIQQAGAVVSRSPEIAECTVDSIIGAVVQASILGFQPVPVLGHCYFVPFKNKKINAREVQFIIGYRGYVDLARRSGEIETIYAQAVYENDKFSYEFGLDPKLYHKPAMNNRGKLTHVYAVAKFKRGGFAFEVMSKADVDKIKARSQSARASFSPWKTDEEEMSKKTVVRRASKYWPMSTDYLTSVAVDEGVFKPEAFKEGEIQLEEVEVPELEVPATGTVRSSAPITTEEREQTEPEPEKQKPVPENDEQPKMKDTPEPEIEKSVTPPQAQAEPEKAPLDHPAEEFARDPEVDYPTIETFDELVSIAAQTWDCQKGKALVRIHDRSRQLYGVTPKDLTAEKIQDYANMILDGDETA